MTRVLRKPMTRSEAGRLGALVAQAKRTDAQRSEIGRLGQAATVGRERAAVLLEAEANGETLTEAQIDAQLARVKRARMFKLQLARQGKLPRRKAGRAA